MSLSAQWQKSFPIPFHLGMSTSNLRAKQLIGLMVIEDWRYCLLFYHQNWRSHSWNLNLFISFYLFLAHILTQQIFIHQILKFCRAELIMSIYLSVCLLFWQKTLIWRLIKSLLILYEIWQKQDQWGILPTHLATLPFNCAFSLRASFNNPLLYFLTRSEWRYFSHHCVNISKLNILPTHLWWSLWSE